MNNVNPTFIAIDNFYTNPYQVREFALNCDYQTPGKSEGYNSGNAPWPGKMSKASYQPKDLDIKISKLLKRNVVQRFGLGSGKFRISKENEVSSSVVHADDIYREPCSYAGVLYLNPNLSNVEGTILYSHVSSGQRILQDKNEMNRIVINNEHKDLKYWQKELVSYITFNRLIIYPAHVFHGTGPMFGSTDEDARMVQLFFWEGLN
jgi:hypothetical protein